MGVLRQVDIESGQMYSGFAGISNVRIQECKRKSTDNYGTRNEQIRHYHVRTPLNAVIGCNNFAS